ncbi:GtrA family protein [Pandoraea pneumonica]|uniref:GtrA family protein n=1 Tax=Pandoraea pneumonica TaxID=2508299 RepID=UPI003CFBB5D5
MIRPILRYAIVGIACNAIGYTAYLVLTWLGVPFKLAMSVLYVLGICISFLGNRNWAFEHRGNVAGTALRFGLAHAAGYLLNLALLTLFVDRLGYPHQWVQAAAIFVVGGFLFVVFKCFVFRHVQPRGNQP